MDTKISNVDVLYQNLGWLGLNCHYSIDALLPLQRLLPLRGVQGSSSNVDCTRG